MKQREDLINEFYLNKMQISRLLGITPQKAKELYEQADVLDNVQLDYRIEENKVRMKSVLKVAGISFEDLKKRTIA